LLDGREIENTAKKVDLLQALGVKKKGNAAWKPARKLDVKASDEVKSKFRLRWRDKDPQNIQKAQSEGWEFIDPAKGIRAEHENPGDSNPLTNTTEYRELVLMGLPEELGKSRDEYFQEQANRNIAGVKNALQRDLDDAAAKEGGYKTKATGAITID
jgi:protein required for attachment to host cells